MGIARDAYFQFTIINGVATHMQLIPNDFIACPI